MTIITGTLLLELGNKIFDKIFPDPVKANEAKLKLLELEQTNVLAQLAAETDIAKLQIETNKVEAARETLFIAGWRPFVGWTCGIALNYHFILQPLLAFTLAIFEHKVELPYFDMDTLFTVLMGMLGLGGLRTYEKLKK